MKPAEFEEKEYEGPLYNQLEAGCPYVWSPGQVFENHIGIDRASLVSNPRFWRLVGHTAPVGAFLNRYNWNFIWRHRGRRPMPGFRLNLFLQAKRPNHYPRAPKHIRAVGMNGPCWSFNVDSGQQAALERVASKLTGKALVAYASPAFHKVQQLYAHQTRATIIENSTFPEVTGLRGHSKWFYNIPGAGGIANPDAEPLEGRSLYQLIDQLRKNKLSEQFDASEPHGYKELQVLSEDIISSLDKAGLDDNPRIALFFEETRNIDYEVKQFEQLGEPIRFFLHVAAFARIFNLEWFAIS